MHFIIMTSFIMAHYMHEPPVKMYAKAPINIAHRGASAYTPEHTLAAYQLALEMKADFVEPDLQITKDGVLICMHDVTLDRTTNVRTVFPDRSRNVKGKERWLVADFTLAEIKSLDAGSWFNAKFAGEKVPTFQEMLNLVRGKAGIIPETKSPESYESHGLSMEKLVMEFLKTNMLDQPGADPATPVVIQSFSQTSLKKLRAEYGCKLPLLLLYERATRDTFSPENLRELKNLVEGVGPSKLLVDQFPNLIKDSHEAGLSVTIYTCRSKQTGNFADVKAEMKHYLKLGVDAVFTDNPDQFPR